MIFTTSYEHADLNLEKVIEWLSKDSYWAFGREPETIKNTFKNSVPISALSEDGEFVGVGRLVTDGYTFGWLCDVFVDSNYRGLGVGHAITKAAISFFEQVPSFRLILKTKDAHKVYKDCGFEDLVSPESWLAIERGF